MTGPDRSPRHGEFITQVFSGRLDFAYSANGSRANLVQYDSESRPLGFQSRFGYILKPGDDLLLALNQG